MRYHFGLLAPNSQMNRQPGSSPLIQRSSPTCTLSLANVTASTASNDTLKDSDAMAVDPPLFSMTSLSTVGNENIPFPTTGKRSHSLLRATAYCAQLTTAARQADEACSTDTDPPRKRTRTSALPSSKTRFNRAISPPNCIFHSNRSTSNSSPPPTTPKLLPASLKNASQIPSGVAQSNPLPSPSHSPIINSPPLHDVPNSTQLVLRPVVRPTQSPRWHHKRTAPSELRLLISLHQVLVYGLALKYPVRKPDIASTADTTADMDSGPLQSGKGEENAYLYVQDAILSQRLRTHLLANGIDAFREAFQGLNSAGLPSATHVVLAYQQLVASLIFRYRSSPNRSRAKAPTRNNSKFQRIPSRLSASGNSD